MALDEKDGDASQNLKVGDTPYSAVVPAGFQRVKEV